MQSRKFNTPIKTRWKFAFFANKFCLLFTWLCQIVINCQIAWILSLFHCALWSAIKMVLRFLNRKKKHSISLLLFFYYCGLKLVGFWGPWLLNAQNQVSSNGLLFWCRAHGTLMFSLVFFSIVQVLVFHVHWLNVYLLVINSLSSHVSKFMKILRCSYHINEEKGKWT